MGHVHGSKRKLKRSRLHPELTSTSALHPTHPRRKIAPHGLTEKRRKPRKKKKLRSENKATRVVALRIKRPPSSQHRRPERGVQARRPAPLPTPAWARAQAHTASAPTRARVRTPPRSRTLLKHAAHIHAQSARPADALTRAQARARARARAWAGWEAQRANAPRFFEHKLRRLGEVYSCTPSLRPRPAQST
jgi:hypothetical protein